jgi:hypothetical protein
MGPRRTVGRMKLDTVAARLDETIHLNVHFRWHGGPVPRSGSVLWVVQGLDPEGCRYDFGYKLVDGQRSALYTFDFGQSRQSNHTIPVVGSFDEDRGSLTIRLPWPTELDYAALHWENAILNIEGEDVDTHVVSNIS